MIPSCARFRENCENRWITSVCLSFAAKCWRSFTNALMTLRHYAFSRQQRTQFSEDVYKFVLWRNVAVQIWRVKELFVPGIVDRSNLSPRREVIDRSNLSPSREGKLLGNNALLFIFISILIMIQLISFLWKNENKKFTRLTAELYVHVGREALAYCQCLYRENKALFVSY